MSVVIGGGLYRSRQIEVPSSLDVPTKSVVRLALGNALYEKVQGSRVLDLFAGSGAVGIELLSRGASSCLFVEKDAEAASVIEKNLAKLRCENGSVMRADAIMALPALSKEKKQFDIIFIDPPYAAMDLYEASVSAVLGLDLLAPSGVLAIEYEKEPSLPLSRFLRCKTYNYGRSHLALLWR